MIEVRLETLDAKTVYQEMLNKMVDAGKSWIREKAKSVQEFPVLQNGQRGLEIGCSFGSSLGCVCRKILQPDGTLVWLTTDYTFHSAADASVYASKATLQQVEMSIKHLKQQQRTIQH